ncbi:hypothetical protein HK101_006900, partial [Irineochytrium annulatum]
MVAGTRYLFTLDPVTGPQGAKQGDVISSAAYDTFARYWYKQCAAQSTSTPSWTPVSVFASMSGGLPEIGVTACVPSLNPTTGKLTGVYAADVSFGVLTNELRVLPVTPNGFVLVFDVSGVLYGSSVATEFVVVNNGGGNVTTKNVQDLTDVNSRTAVEYILATTSGLASLPINGTYLTAGLIFQHTVVTVTGNLNVIVVAGAPQTDYLGDLESTQRDLQTRLRTNGRNVLLLSVGLVIVLIAASMPVTSLMLARPMRRLALHMEEVSRFEFSSLKGADKNERSFIRELGQMQNAFWVMTLAFARGISENKKLAAKTYTG